MKKQIQIIGLITFALTFIACDKGVGKIGSNEANSAKAKAKIPSTFKANAAPKEDNSDSLAAVGKVIETMDAASYTYVKLKNEKGEIWAAGPKTSVKVGDVIRAERAMMMKNFKSNSLNRTFKEILFAGALVKPSSVAGKKQNMPNPHQGVGKVNPRVSQQAVAVKKVKKADGENGKTIGEIYNESKTLNGKMIAVRGVVVKATNNIMGKNWIHIQDSTGEATKRTHDLTLTTQDKVKAGDIVLAKGVLAANKDFGSGYRYNVIIEKAKLSVEKAK